MAKFNNNVEHKEFVAWHVCLQDLMNQKGAWNEMVKEMPERNMAQSYQHKIVKISENFTHDGKSLVVEFFSDETANNICFYLVDQNGHDDGTRFLCGNRMFSDSFVYTGDKYAADVAGCVLSYLEENGLIKYQSDDLDSMANDMHASLITLENGTKIFQTSAHGARFSDGTVFEPTEEQKESIKRFWGFLQVKRSFSKISFNEMPGIGVSESRQTLSDDTLAMMTAIQTEFSDCIFLVSFMVVSAMKEMGIRNDYPRWVAANATPDTSREAPDKKVWDINNFAY